MADTFHLSCFQTRRGAHLAGARGDTDVEKSTTRRPTKPAGLFCLKVQAFFRFKAVDGRNGLCAI